MSARTGGSIMLQLLYDMSKPGSQFDRVLNAPTNDAWIGPWQKHLEEKYGVTFHFGATVTGFTCSGGEISQVKTSTGPLRAADFDYFVAALPVEVLRDLLTSTMKRLDPGLKKLVDLELGWMNGVMFYLRRDVKIVHGHTLYIDSPWALTSISQKQFWPRVRLEKMGDGTVRGILSVDVSDWTANGSNGKCAKECTADEVTAEVWAQLQAHLNDDPVEERLRSSNRRRAFVDPAIDFSGAKVTNDEPLLINTAGSWYRPSGRRDPDTEPVPRGGLRPHEHGSRDHGGGQ